LRVHVRVCGFSMDEREGEYKRKKAKENAYKQVSG